MTVREIDKYEGHPPAQNERVLIYGKDAVFHTPYTWERPCDHCVIKDESAKCQAINCKDGVFIDPIEFATMRLTGEIE